MKRSFFQTAVMSSLQYACTTWTLTKHMENKLDSDYTRICEQYWTSSGGSTPKKQYLPPITKTIKIRRTRLAGHCRRSRDEIIRDVLLWTSLHGRAKAGRQARTYIQQLCANRGCSPEAQPKTMDDRGWRERSGISMLIVRHDDDVVAGLSDQESSLSSHADSSYFPETHTHTHQYSPSLSLSLSLSLFIRPYHLSLPAGLPNNILK